MAKLRYDTVREVSYSPDQLTLLSDSLQSMGQLYSLSQLISSGPDPIRLAQVKDVIETVTTGRKYQVLLLRSQGKTTLSRCSILFFLVRQMVYKTLMWFLLQYSSRYNCCHLF